MSAQIDCPICMDCIESTNKNCVTTECGHCFHASCLMQSVAHNGFGCPYCRTVMAELPVDPDDDYDDDYSDDDDATVFEEDTLTSFRMFHQRINGEEVEEEEDDVEEEEDEQEVPSVPDAAYVAQKLAERGITFEDLVKKILFEEDFDNDDLESYANYERKASEIYGQFRAIISRYRPSIPDVQPEVPVVTTPSVPIYLVKPIIAIDFDAQPKLPKVSFVRNGNCY